MPRTKEKKGAEKAIPVDQRLLKRFDYQRQRNEKKLWDDSLQEGVSFFRGNIATLFIDEHPVIEGILIYLKRQKKYFIFDRRTKKSILLEPGTGQKLWLRRDEI